MNDGLEPLSLVSNEPQRHQVKSAFSLNKYIDHLKTLFQKQVKISPRRSWLPVASQCPWMHSQLQSLPDSSDTTTAPPKDFMSIYTITSLQTVSLVSPGGIPPRPLSKSPRQLLGQQLVQPSQNSASPSQLRMLLPENSALSLHEDVWQDSLAIVCSVLAHQRL